jgi:hypothetical protein
MRTPREPRLSARGFDRQQAPGSREEEIARGWAIRVLLVSVVMAAAASGAVFTATAAGCGYESRSGTGPQIAVTAQSECGPGWMYVNANAQASGYGLRAFASGYQYCCATAGLAIGSASVQTEYIIHGPPGSGPVPMSLNLVLTGNVGGGTSDGSSGRYVRVDLTMGYAGWFFIQYGEQSNGSQGISYYFASNIQSPQGYSHGACVSCRLRTAQVLVPVNTPLSFHMLLQAWINQFGDAYGYADASNTLYFPTEGPVFDLPEGYSAEIFGMNVVGNRVVLPEDPGGEIPEPAVAGLTALGLAGFLILRRRP